MRSNRIEEMAGYIDERMVVSMEELCQHFGMSINTIRRDVAQLQKMGKINKVYGGVQSIREGELVSYHTRRAQNEREKTMVGQLAAQYVKDGDVIFIDSGTTTREVVRHLAGKQNLVVITHSLSVINEVSLLSNAGLIVLPGMLNRDTGSFTGSNTTRELRGYNITIAFMAASGYSLTNQVTNSSVQEFEIKQAAIEHSKRSMLLLDHFKFGKNGLLTYAQMDAFSHVVVDKEPAEKYVDAIKKAGAQLITPDTASMRIEMTL